MAAGEQKDKEGSTSTSAGKERAGSSSSSASRDEAFAARLADPNVGECGRLVHLDEVIAGLHSGIYKLQQTDVCNASSLYSHFQPWHPSLLAHTPLRSPSLHDFENITCNLQTSA